MAGNVLERKSLAGKGEAKVVRRYEEGRSGFNKPAPDPCRRFRLLNTTVNHHSIYLTANASSFLPPLSAATSHLGLLPRPAHVSLRFLGLR